MRSVENVEMALSPANPNKLWIKNRDPSRFWNPAKELSTLKYKPPKNTPRIIDAIKCDAKIIGRRQKSVQERQIGRAHV